VLVVVVGVFILSAPFARKFKFMRISRRTNCDALSPSFHSPSSTIPEPQQKTFAALDFDTDADASSDANSSLSLVLSAGVQWFSAVCFSFVIVAVAALVCSCMQTKNETEDDET